MGRISAKGRFEPFRRSKESVANSNVPNPGQRVPSQADQPTPNFLLPRISYLCRIAVRTIVPDYAVPQT
jgi:hypothetical protein